MDTLRLKAIEEWVSNRQKLTAKLRDMVESEQSTGADDIAVIYIARGGDGGLESAQRFLKSYKMRQGGQPHTLTIVTKGWSSEAELSRLHALFQQVACEWLPLPDDGFDLGAYFRAAQQIQTSWLLCLNTHSEILADNWIRLLFACVRTPGVGAAGATGSWESHTTALLRKAAPTNAVDRLKQLFELWWFKFHFPRFPNPHLRTNAFMIRREDLLAYAAQTRVPKSKKEAWVIESARSGLTAFLFRSHRRVMVCGADGRTFPVKEWFSSQTYFSGQQTNLLVADSQTRRYQNADRKHRGGMQVSAWGQVDDSVL